MKKCGTFKVKHSREIQKSKIGIGFECLDRQMWDDSNEVYRYAGELGVKFARVQTGWARTEIVAGKYDFAWLDRIVNQLLEAGIEPWLNLSYGNPLYIVCDGADGVGNHPMNSDTACNAWCCYITVLVNHYKDRINKYEIWNEGDSDAFWKPSADPSSHVGLMKITAETIRKNTDNAIIIGGAFANGLTVKGFSIIKQHLDCGMADIIDVFSFHHYKTVIELERAELLVQLRNLFAEYGKPDIRLWQGEGGFPSKTGKTQALNLVPVTEDIQAQMLLRYVINDLAMDIELCSYFQMSDFKFYSFGGICREPNHFGVVTFDQPPRRKPSYYVLQRIASLFDAETEVDKFGFVELYPDDDRAESDRYSFPVKALKCSRHVFKRCNYPLISYHCVSNIIQNERCNELINMDVWLYKTKFTEPVLIDPISGEVFDDLSYSDTGHGHAFRNLPLRSHPLILTDRNAIEIN